MARFMNVGTSTELAKLINLDLVESIVDMGDSRIISFASSVPLGGLETGKIKAITSKLTIGELFMRMRAPGEVFVI